MNYEDEMDVNCDRQREIERRLQRGYYDRPHVIDRVVEQVLADMGLDDSDDVTRMNEEANKWTA